MTLENESSTKELVTENLIDLLTLEKLDTDLYRGKKDKYRKGRGRVFGGQVIAQALNAMIDTVDEEKIPHSLHAYFLRAGENSQAVIYQLSRDFDGRSFSNRRVTALQNGQPILTMTGSFHKQQEGFDHQINMPDAGRPENYPTDQENAKKIRSLVPKEAFKFISRPRPIEIRRLAPRITAKADINRKSQAKWFRLAQSRTLHSSMHYAILAYASDMSLLSTCMLPHGKNWYSPDTQNASLDHALWFHNPVNVNEWMFYDMNTNWAGHARGHNQGRIFANDGTLIATTCQEGLFRRRK